MRRAGEDVVSGEIDVLVLDDEPVVAAYVEMLLQDWGIARTCCVHDLNTAEAVSSQCRPRLAILDVNIGHELVFPFASKLREAGINTLFCTGMNRADFPAEWASASIVSKPADPEVLRAHLISQGMLGPAPHEPINA